MLKFYKSKIGVVYICNHEDNTTSQLSPQWLYGNSCNWEKDAQLLHIAVANEEKCVQKAKSRLRCIW